MRRKDRIGFGGEVTKSLLVGFNEFFDWRLNPARITVETIRSDAAFAAEVGLIAEVLPTEFDAAGRRVVQLITEHRPNVVIVVGMAAGRQGVSLERVALNLNDTDKPDNSGKSPQGSLIVADGPLAYWSTLPLKHLSETLAGQGIPAQITNFAGTFVCNHTFYLARHTLEVLGLGAACGLVHIPLMTEQLDEAQAKSPSLPAAQLARAVAICVRESFGEIGQ
jgi:pyroglutamyl-peptidase